jgi:hypothetical protein
MNALEKYITESKLNEVATMNELQDNAIISDNCVMASCVSETDCQKAITWLEQNQGRLLA